MLIIVVSASKYEMLDLRPQRDCFPGYPVVPAVFVLLEVAIIFGAFQIDANRSAAWIGVCWIAVAVVCYLLFFRRGSTTRPGPAH